MKKLIVIFLMMFLSGCVSSRQSLVNDILLRDLLVGGWRVVSMSADIFDQVNPRPDETFTITADGKFIKIIDESEPDVDNPRTAYTYKNGYIIMVVGNGLFKMKIDFVNKDKIKATGFKISWAKPTGNIKEKRLIAKASSLLEGAQVVLTRQN